MQRRVERGKRGPNGLRVTRGIGCFNGFGGLQHRPVPCAQSSIGFFALGRLAVESVVNRFSECVPQLLLLAAIDRHLVCLRLPALLQGTHCIHPQYRRCA